MFKRSVNVRFALILSAIIGATSMAQLTANIADAQLVLPADVLAAIAAVQVRYPNPSGN